jgi:uncharacterized protein YbaR (Trm112 family)
MTAPAAPARQILICPHCRTPHEIFVRETVQHWYRLDHIEPPDYYEPGPAYGERDAVVDQEFFCDVCRRSLPLTEIVVADPTEPPLPAAAGDDPRA